MSSNAKRDDVIVRKAVGRQLSYLSKEVEELVIERISNVAQGTAIWTKMMIELIKVRGIREFAPMQLFLEEIPLPGQLSKLYIDLLSRCTSNGPEGHGLAKTALKLLAIARRPLSVLELAWAAALGTVRQEIPTVAALAKMVDHQRVMSLIHPFIARIEFNDVKKRQVRLIHQSVKEFIINEWAFDQPCSQGPALLAETVEAHLDQRLESLEVFIFNICVRYLLLHEIGNTALFSEEHLAIEELPEDVDLFDNGQLAEYDLGCTWEACEENMIRYDPADRGFGEFFVYASSYWIQHYSAVTTEPLPDLANIENLCQAGSTRLHNWTQQNCRPGCVIKQRFEFESSLYDPLSITSLYGSEAMLRHMLENSGFDKDTYLPEPATGAADQILQWGDSSRLRILFLEGKLGHQLHNLDFFRLIIKHWSQPGANCHNWDSIFDLVDYVLDTLVRERWGNELLRVAADACCMPIIRRLIAGARHEAELRTELLRRLQHEQHSSPFGKSARQSITEAVLGNHVDVIEYLLREKDIEVLQI